MPEFTYTAKDEAGKQVRGKIKAQDLSDFYSRLREQGLLCLSYKEALDEVKKTKTIYKLSYKELNLFCRKMGSMLSAGMGVKTALDVLYTTAENSKLKRVLLGVYERIQQGSSLSDALNGQGNAFPPILIHMAESGEMSGNMDEVMHTLAAYFEKQSKLKNKINAATAYPKVLCVVATGVIILIFTVVMPRLFSLFEGMELPPLTKFVVAISVFLREQYVWLIIIGVTAAILINILLHIKVVAAYLDMLKIRTPIIGKLVSKVYSSQFASSMAILYSSGIPLISSLKMAVTVIGSPYIEEKFIAIVDSVSKGQALSTAIDDIHVFDKMLPSMVRIGEESGSLDAVLLSISEYYDMEAEAAIERLLGILEPALLVVMAFVIGAIIISVITPIYGMYANIQ